VKIVWVTLQNVGRFVPTLLRGPRRLWAQRATILVTLGSAVVTGMYRQPATIRCAAAMEQGQWREAQAACVESTTRGSKSDVVLLAKAELQLGNDVEAQRLAKTALGGPLRGEALSILGRSLDRLGEPQAARDALYQAIEIFQARGDDGELARNWYALAGSCWRDRQLSEALSALDTAESHAVALNDRQMLGLIALMRGDVMRAVGDAASAEQQYGLAAISLAGRQSDMAFVDLKLGMLRQEAGLLHLSDLSFQRALSRAVEVGNKDAVTAARQNLAYNAHLQGDTAGGLLQIADWQGPFDFSHYSVKAMLEADDGKWVEALASIDQALAVSRGNDNWWGEYERARILEHLGDDRGARSGYEQSIACVERTRSAMDLGELQPWMIPRRRLPYEALLRSFVRHGEHERALSVLEAFSARSFVDALIASGSLASAPSETENIAAKWQRLDPSGASPSNLSETLGDREIVMPVEVLGQLYLAHKPANAHVRFIDRGAAKPIRALIAKFSANPDDLEAASALGRILMPDELEPSDRTLHIVASGSLADVPYAALRRDGQYLIEQRPLAAAPSLRSFSMRYAQPPTRGALVIADADGDLPAARREALETAALLDTTALVADDATRATIENAGPLDILHLGTHSGLDGSGAWLSLSDGRWSTDSILDSGSRARVVVLASCSSGSTRHQEVWGSLAIAFLANGSESVISAIGSVNDADTGELMRALYRADVRRKPVRALAEAQRSLLEKKEPHAWARFVVHTATDD